MDLGISALLSKMEAHKQKRQDDLKPHQAPVETVWVFLFPIYGGWACSPYAFSAEAQCAEHMQKYKGAIGPFPVRLDLVSTK